MALTRDDREKFLAEPLVAALAVDAIEDGRAPLMVPIWYQYEPGGDIWIMTGRNSRKAAAIRAAGRFALMVDRLEPTVRYVSVEGPVVDTVQATREQLVELSARYLEPGKVEAYVDFLWNDDSDQVVIRMRPQRWISSDLGEA
ncbi:pyridoxamine 5'-phosphate oxidase family protein [Streptomyces xantholiticus]|uniref:pyridoxamine 5'-phosphate oxidase family protein n=1 Tax=Streptomyces xantholiticus TaxID=68285 RepID=UPI001673E81E|nr:pyridoxamine 5'-phosphate oxidase family protein [Streptomyces xantholiticus]GGW40487.1 pyridoxamine 5'-phosphate oxidase [Streptomyces xantholiticus]